MSQLAFNILPRKTFELTLEDGSKVRGRFGTYALSLFCTKKGKGISAALEIFKDDPQPSDLADYIICAIESIDRLEGKPPSMNHAKLFDWIDLYAEVNGENGILNKIMAVANTDIEQPADPSEQKKTLAGQTSSEPTLQPVEQ